MIGIKKQPNTIAHDHVGLHQGHLNGADTNPSQGGYEQELSITENSRDNSKIKWPTCTKVDRIDKPICSSEVAKIRSALAYIPADDRDLWLRVGMAIKSELGDYGFDIWNEWSQQAVSYRPDDARSAWKSMQVEGGITIKTLARKHGYKNHSHSQLVNNTETPKTTCEEQTDNANQRKIKRTDLQLMPRGKRSSRDHHNA